MLLPLVGGRPMPNDTPSTELFGSPDVRVRRPSVELQPAVSAKTAKIKKGPPRPEPGGLMGELLRYRLIRYVRSPPSGLKDSTA